MVYKKVVLDWPNLKKALAPGQTSQESLKRFLNSIKRLTTAFKPICDVTEFVSVRIILVEYCRYVTVLVVFSVLYVISPFTINITKKFVNLRKSYKSLILKFAEVFKEIIVLKAWLIFFIKKELKNLLERSKFTIEGLSASLVRIF